MTLGTPHLREINSTLTSLGMYVPKHLPPRSQGTSALHYRFSKSVYIFVGLFDNPGI